MYLQKHDRDPPRGPAATVCSRLRCFHRIQSAALCVVLGRCAATTSGLFIPSIRKGALITELSSLGRAVHPHPLPTVLAASTGPSVSSGELLIALNRSGIKTCLYCAFGQKYPLVSYMAMLYRVHVPGTPIHLDLAVNQQFGPNVAPLVAILRKHEATAPGGEPDPDSESDCVDDGGMVREPLDSMGPGHSDADGGTPRGPRHQAIHIDRVAQRHGVFGFVGMNSLHDSPPVPHTACHHDWLSLSTLIESVAAAAVYCCLYPCTPQSRLSTRSSFARMKSKG